MGKEKEILELTKQVQELERQVEELEKKLEKDLSEKRILIETTKLIRELGIPAKLHGYHFIRSAVLLTIKEPSLINQITKTIYLQVADRYGSTPDRVEHSIRVAIEVAFLRGNKEELDELFGYTIDPKKGKPTNSEFIAIIADTIKLNLL